MILAHLFLQWLMHCSQVNRKRQSQFEQPIRACLPCHPLFQYTLTVTDFFFSGYNLVLCTRFHSFGMVSQDLLSHTSLDTLPVIYLVSDCGRLCLLKLKSLQNYIMIFFLKQRLLASIKSIGSHFCFPIQLLLLF